MRTYYLFIIQSDCYKTYKTAPEVLYQTLQNLYTMRESDFTYGISLFESICEPFSVKLLKNYIQDKYAYTMKNKKIMRLHIPKELSYIQILYPCVIIKSNVNFPEILKVFHIYNKKIFVCDFATSDYFWLSNQIIKRK